MLGGGYEDKGVGRDGRFCGWQWSHADPRKSRQKQM